MPAGQNLWLLAVRYIVHVVSNYWSDISKELRVYIDTVHCPNFAAVMFSFLHAWIPVQYMSHMFDVQLSSRS